jgi:hypothetical protein
MSKIGTTEVRGQSKTAANKVVAIEGFRASQTL